jgi:hypothetical protein
LVGGWSIGISQTPAERTPLDVADDGARMLVILALLRHSNTGAPFVRRNVNGGRSMLAFLPKRLDTGEPEIRIPSLVALFC